MENQFKKKGKEKAKKEEIEVSRIPSPLCVHKQMRQQTHCRSLPTLKSWVWTG